MNGLNIWFGALNGYLLKEGAEEQRLTWYGINARQIALLKNL